MREKGKEFDKMEAEALARQAERGKATNESSCNFSGGVWMGRNFSSGGYCQ